MRITFGAILFLLSAVIASADAAPLKIMAMGDSITHGVDGASPNGDATAGGYRPYLSARMGVIEHEWIGRRPDGPPIAVRHEGWGGYSIRQLDNNIVDDALDEWTPDVVLLMIGTNDAWNAPGYHDPLTTRERMLENVNNLLHHIRNRVPQSRIVVSTLPPFGFPNPLGEAARVVFNDGLDELVHDLQGEGFDIGMVNAGGRVPASLIADGLHPNQQGYQMIADGFYEAFLLPSAPEPGAGAVVVGISIVALLRQRRSKIQF